MDHEQQFHDVVIHRRAGGLHHEHVGATHVFLDLDVVLAVLKALTWACARSTPRFWQISVASAGLAFPLKILMRSGFIARTGFGAAIVCLWCAIAAFSTTPHDTGSGSPD